MVGSLCPDSATTALSISLFLVSVWPGHQQGEQCPGTIPSPGGNKDGPEAYTEPWFCGGKLGLAASEQCGSRALASLELETLQVDVCSMFEQCLYSL